MHVKPSILNQCGGQKRLLLDDKDDVPVAKKRRDKDPDHGVGTMAMDEEASTETSMRLPLNDDKGCRKSEMDEILCGKNDESRRNIVPYTRDRIESVTVNLPLKKLGNTYDLHCPLLASCDRISSLAIVPYVAASVPSGVKAVHESQTSADIMQQDQEENGHQMMLLD